MTQPTFNFPIHTVTHTYPKGTAFQMGKGYQFNAQPLLPVQRTFRLSFSALQWFINDQGQADPTINPTYNILALIEFYESVRSYQAFTYNHPVYGALTVKFAADQQFEVPKSIPGGSGVTEPMEIFLVEQLLDINSLNTNPVITNPSAQAPQANDGILDFSDPNNAEYIGALAA